MLSFIRSYLTYRTQRCKIEDHFRKWHGITTDFPQGSILGPLLFNVFINDIFLFLESSNVLNYANNNTLFAFGKTFNEVTRKLQNDFLILDEWFFNIFLVLNSNKCHFMAIGPPNTLPDVKRKGFTIKGSASKNML